MTKSLEIYRSTRTTVIKTGRVSSHRGSLPFLRYLHELYFLATITDKHKFHPPIFIYFRKSNESNQKAHSRHNHLSEDDSKEA